MLSRHMPHRRAHLTCSELDRGVGTMPIIRGCCVVVSVQDPALIVAMARTLCCWRCGSVYAWICA